MSDSFQLIFNAVLGVATFLLGLTLKTLYDRLHELSVADLDLVTKVQAIEVLVAGSYIKRTEMERMYEALFSKLDRIENKLDGKMDKPKP